MGRRLFLKVCWRQRSKEVQTELSEEMLSCLKE